MEAAILRIDASPSSNSPRQVEILIHARRQVQHFVVARVHKPEEGESLLRAVVVVIRRDAHGAAAADAWVTKGDMLEWWGEKERVRIKYR